MCPVKVYNIFAQNSCFFVESSQIRQTWTVSVNPSTWKIQVIPDNFISNSRICKLQEIWEVAWNLLSEWCSGLHSLSTRMISWVTASSSGHQWQPVICWSEEDRKIWVDHQKHWTLMKAPSWLQIMSVNYCLCWWKMKLITANTSV